MEEGRANRIANVYKNIKTLGNNIKIPSAISSIIQPEQTNAIGIPVQGTGFIRILMYFIAGLLIIGIILLGVDQWITPVFQRSPGAPGYIPIPGTDNSQVFWLSRREVRDIVVGAVPPPVYIQGVPPVKQPPSMTVIEGQSSYSITMDVLITDEYPQSLPAGYNQRIFFVLSHLVDDPTLQVSIDNSRNTVYITCFDPNGYQQSIEIDNVPIRSTFRIGLTMSSYAMEGYLNGLLVKTRQLDSIPKSPATGDKIFAPASIIIGGKNLAKGVTVLKVRGFGYTVSSAEMRGRMSDLVVETATTPTSGSNSQCSN